jgi:hypothetical protein
MNEQLLEWSWWNKMDSAEFAELWWNQNQSNYKQPFSGCLKDVALWASSKYLRFIQRIQRTRDIPYKVQTLLLQAHMCIRTFCYVGRTNMARMFVAAPPPPPMQSAPYHVFTRRSITMCPYIAFVVSDSKCTFPVNSYAANSTKRPGVCIQLHLNQ